MLESRTQIKNESKYTEIENTGIDITPGTAAVIMTEPRIYTVTSTESENRNRNQVSDSVG